MTTETALPTDGNVAAGEQANTTQAAADQTTVQPGEQAQGTEVEQTPEQKAEAATKKEKTDQERENARLRRRVDNLTRRRYELEAQLSGRSADQPRQQQEKQTQASDGESVTVSLAELDRMVEERAEKRAPSIAEQRAESERRNGIVKTLEKEWGKEEFDAKASDLDDAFGGLADAHGRPKPATDAIFEADDPKAVIEYLTNPDNADDAERIARLPALRAGREIARIEAKLKDEAAKAKPQPSNAAKPVTATKGSGTAQKEWAQLEGKDFFEHRRKFGARR